jgi:hypothetical protein
VLKASQTNPQNAKGQQTTQEDRFQEEQRQKRRATEETAGISRKMAVQTKTSPALNMLPKQVLTRKYLHGQRRLRY